MFFTYAQNLISYIHYLASFGVIIYETNTYGKATILLQFEVIVLFNPFCLKMPPFRVAFFASYFSSPAKRPLLHAHWRLYPPQSPSMSKTSPQA